MRPTLYTLLACFSLHASNGVSECHYLKPEKEMAADIFRTLQDSSNRADTFGAVADLIEEARDSCHQFEFKYALKNREEAEVFSKVMRIKAQAAHWFVPVIKDCQVVEKRNLGFLRQVTIQDGPIVQENVLIDQESGSVLFIEEAVLLPNGRELPGAFAAINRVIEEEGDFYFHGIYLYDEEPDLLTIEKRDEMFRATYENMLRFLCRNNLKKWEFDSQLPDQLYIEIGS